MFDRDCLSAITVLSTSFLGQVLAWILRFLLILPVSVTVASSLDEEHFPPPIGPVEPLDDSVTKKLLTTPDYEHQIIEIVNEERLNNGGLAPLKLNASLNNSSETHSENMGTRNFVAHCDLDTKTSPFDRMASAGYTGYSRAGENIAWGYSTPELAMQGWMNSTGHRNNILSTNYCEIGVGYYLDSNDQNNVRSDENGDCDADGTIGFAPNHYWTQNFGCRFNNYPVVINREAYATDTPSVQLYLYGDGWAQEMRIRNAGDSWPAWRAYSSNVNWQLSTGNGTKTVEVELRSGSTVRSASDSIVLEAEPADVIFADDFE